MARTSSGGRTAAIHHPLPPPSAQKQFPSRRRTARPTPRLPTLSKKQSTLTQLPEWQMSSSSSSGLSDMIGLSDENLSEVEYVEPRPTKRRRTGTRDHRTESQPSLTQWDRYKAVTATTTKRKRDESKSGDESQVMEDDLPRSTRRKTRAMNAEARNTARRKPSHQSRRQLEVAVSPSPTKTTIHGHNLRSSAKKENLPKPDANLRTPRRKLAFTEIPSSQSPLSAKLSTQKSVHYRNAKRSPLKERSANVPVTSPSPSKRKQSQSQPSAMKMLQRVHMEQLMERRNRAAAAAAESPPPLPVTFTASLLDKQNTSTTYGEAKSPERTLKRNTTIQDSQFEGGELDLDNAWCHADTQYAWNNGDSIEHYRNDNDDNDDNDVEPNTYDPAFSALDRDATRFLETQMQTQGHTQGPHCLTPHISNSTGSGADEILASDSEDEEDLDNTVLAPHRTVEDNSDASSRQLSQELGDSLKMSRMPNRQVDPSAGAVIPDSGSLAPSQQRDENGEAYDRFADGNVSTTSTVIIHIPSSPPLHPSQISTVVPTQISSPQRPCSRRSQWDDMDPQTVQQPYTFDLTTLPESNEPPMQQDHHEDQTHVPSSSSLARPPLREHAEYDGADYGEEEEANLLLVPSSSPLPIPPCPSSPTASLPAVDMQASQTRSPKNGKAHGKLRHNAVRQTATYDGAEGMLSEASLSSLLDFSLPPPPLMSSSSAHQ